MRVSRHGQWQILVLMTAVVAALGGSVAPSGGAAPEWADAPVDAARLRVEDLGTLGGAISLGRAINDDGWVVGESEAVPGNHQRRAFLWRNGRMIDLGADPQSVANDINNRGQVVGTTLTADRGEQAFLWERGRLTLLPGFGDDRTGALGINEQGHIVGFRSPEPNVFRAFVWRNGHVTDLAPVAGVSFGEIANGLNDPGDVVGVGCDPCRPALWRRAGGDPLLPIPPDTIYGFANAVNDRQQVVGFVQPRTDDGLVVMRATRWDHGRIRDLGGLGGLQSVADGINDAGHIVGFATTPEGQTQAWVWRSGRLRSLQGLVRGGYSDAADINEHGHIVGTSASGAVGDGVSHAVIWR